MAEAELGPAVVFGSSHVTARPKRTVELAGEIVFKSAAQALATRTVGMQAHLQKVFRAEVAGPGRVKTPGLVKVEQEAKTPGPAHQAGNVWHVS